MPLLPPPTAAPTAPTSRPLADRQKQAKAQIEGMARMQYQQFCRMQKEGIRAMWQNPDGLTPQQFADAAGTNGGKLISFHGALTEFIVKVAAADGVAPDIALPTNAFTVNPDGTVTVLDTPYGA